MAKKKKRQENTTLNTGIGIPASELYNLVKEKDGNVHPDYCFFYREWEETFGSKTKQLQDEGVCNKIDPNTLCCISYPNPTTMIRPDNPLRGCPMSPVERNKKAETVIRINPLKASKRARRMGK